MKLLCRRNGILEEDLGKDRVGREKDEPVDFALADSESERKDLENELAKVREGGKV